MNEPLLRDAMLGLHVPHGSLVLYGILELDPAAVQFAKDVPDDAFLIKLRHHLTTQNKQPSMENAVDPRCSRSGVDVGAT